MQNTAHLPVRCDRLKLGGVAQRAAWQTVAAQGEKHQLNLLSLASIQVKPFAVFGAADKMALFYAIPMRIRLRQKNQTSLSSLVKMSRQNRVGGQGFARLSDRHGSRVDIREFRRDTNSPSQANPQYPICNTVRKFVGPFVDCLVRNTHGNGSI